MTDPHGWPDASKPGYPESPERDALRLAAELEAAAVRALLDDPAPQIDPEMLKAAARMLQSVAAREAAASEACIEATARAIYQQWFEQPGWVPWVEHGNSTRQDDARRLARRALPLPAPDALSRVRAEARREGMEKAAQEVDCGCAARADVLARLATDGDKRASYLCVHGDVCCALQAAAIRARGKEVGGE